MVTAVRASACVPYEASDFGTGRCRMSRAAFQKLNVAKMGSILKLELTMVEKRLIVLCTAWPDPSNFLNDDTICVDDSVLDVDCSSYFSWVEAECKVLRIDPPTTLTSVYVSGSTSTVKNADLLGLPCSPMCRINLPGNRPLTATISRTSSGGAGVVSTQCLVMNEAAADSGTESSSEQSPRKSSYSNISVVKEISYRTVLPYVTSCDMDTTRNNNLSLIRGMLLVGPPGVGKTYAVKAVQAMCAHVCKVRIYEINIPTLLSEADPIAALEKQFSSIAALTRTPVGGAQGGAGSETASGMWSPSTPSKPGFTSVMSTPQSSAGFMSPGSVASAPARNNTFTYRSPIAMQASAAAAASAAKAVTPSTVKKTVSKDAASATPVPSTPAVKAPFVSPFANAGAVKKGPKGVQTPPPTSFKDMLSASRGGKGMSATAAAAVVQGVEVEEDITVTGVVQYAPELAFVVIDEIDALGNAGLQNESQIAIKQYLCQWLDHQSRITPRRDAVHAVLVGTSNRSGDIDPVLRRGGRLEHEIAVLNTQEDRRCLLQSLLARVFSAEDAIGRTGAPFLWESEVSILADKVAMQTGGYVAADLAALVRAMHALAVEQGVSSGARSVLQMMGLFHVAAKSVPPSCLRGATITLPSLTFDDVIGYEEVKSSLQRVLCFAKPEQQALSSRFGLHSSPGGVLLHGPPGNSKTRLASAAAAHHGLPMISLSAADIYSPYVGDAEAEVRRAFQLARQAAPCVLFIDELDSIVTNRSNDSGGGSTSATVEGRVLATLLTEMDGIQNTNDSEFSSAGKGANSSGGVIVLGATNRLDFIDAALLRKGRFHHVLLVPLPNATERRLLLNYFAKKCGLLGDGAREASGELVQRLKEGMSGAEIENVCREATLEKHRALMV